MFWNCSGGMVRKGPPEAVSQIERTSCGRTGTHGLMDGVVLAVDGQQHRIAAASFFHKDFAGGDHALLICDPHRFARHDGRVGSFQAGDADNGADHKIDLRQCCRVDGTGRSMNDLNPRNSRRAKALAQAIGESFVRERNNARAPSPTLIESCVQIASGGEAYDGKTVRIAFDDAQRALSDGAGGTENREMFQSVLILTFVRQTLVRCCPCSCAAGRRPPGAQL